MKNPRLVRWIFAAAILLITAFLAAQTLTLEIGLAKYNSNDPLSAMPWLHAAMVMNPYGNRARASIATLLIHEGKFDEAERLIIINLKKRPHVAQNHNIMGIIYESRMNFSKALEEYETAVKLDPEYAEALFNIGFLQYKTGRIEDSRATLEKAVQLAPELAASRDKILKQIQPPPQPQPFTPAPPQ